MQQQDLFAHFKNLTILTEHCVKCTVLKLVLLSHSVFPILKVEAILVTIPNAKVTSPLFVSHVCGRPENLCACVCLLVIHANYFGNVRGSRFIL